MIKWLIEKYKSRVKAAAKLKSDNEGLKKYNKQILAEHRARFATAGTKEWFDDLEEDRKMRQVQQEIDDYRLVRRWMKISALANEGLSESHGEST